MFHAATKRCLGLVVLCCVVPALAQPANDSCTSPQVVAGEQSIAFDNSLATTDFASSCGVLGQQYGASAGDLWFQYIPSFTGRATVAACDDAGQFTMGFPVLSLHPACGQEPTRCNDSDCVDTDYGSLSFPVTAGTPYLIRLASAPESEDGVVVGTGTLTFAQRTAAFPAGDECTTPRNVGVGTFTWSNVNATTNQLSAGQTIFKDIWFRFMPPSTGVLSASTCVSAGTQRNTIISVRNSCFEADYASNDDASVCTIGGGGSLLYVPVTAGVPVLVRVGTASVQDAGGGQSLTLAMLPAVANDSCATPIPITSGSFTAELRGATLDGASSSFCDQFLFPSVSDVWYSYTPAEDGLLDVSLCGVQEPVRASIHIDCSEISTACDNGTCGFGGTNALRAVTAGIPVLIRIGTVDAAAIAEPVPFRVSLRSCDAYSLPAGALAEPDPCGPTPETNGGCATGEWIGIDTGVVRTGTSWAVDQPMVGVPFSDRDHYRFTLASPATVSITGQAQFLGNFTLLDITNCATRTIKAVASNFSPTCVNMELTQELPAGTYEISVRYNRGLIYTPMPCDSGRNEYWLRLDIASCDSIDFNRNDVFPEDQDVIDFFNVLAGGPCPYPEPCDIDFNNNGVFPEDQDVIDFFTVLAGGNCS